MVQCTCWPLLSNKVVSYTVHVLQHTFVHTTSKGTCMSFQKKKQFIIFSQAELVTTKFWALCKCLVYQTWKLPEMNYCLKFTKWRRKRKATNQTKRWVYHYFVSQIKLISSYITGIHHLQLSIHLLRWKSCRDD